MRTAILTLPIFLVVGIWVFIFFRPIRLYTSIGNKSAVFQVWYGQVDLTIANDDSQDFFFEFDYFFPSRTYEQEVGSFLEEEPVSLSNTILSFSRVPTFRKDFSSPYRTVQIGTPLWVLFFIASCPLAYTVLSKRYAEPN